METYIAFGQEEGARVVIGGNGMPDGLDVAHRIRAGAIGVNTCTADFAAPFGGRKASGVGRGFGPEGIGEYAELKSTYTGAPQA